MKQFTVTRGEDFSPFCANRMKSPHNLSTDEWMRRRFYVNLKLKEGFPSINIREQFWYCSETQTVMQDDEQKECAERAYQLALESDKPVLFYHTRAWKI